MKPTPPARLHVILAGEAPLAAVIRSGPAKQVCTILWNRRTDEFILGETNALAVAARTVDAEDGF